ncbi:MAG: carbohydrate ABC transporter permease [Clostridiaceae bacterium]|nr:carbohydrate ABC transporter permease [Clostridiaceae bacterium]
MKVKKSIPYRIFSVFNWLILGTVTLSCVFPILHILAISLSDSTSAAACYVSFLPVDFSLEAYQYLLVKKDFINSVSITLTRVVAGSVINMIIIVLTAYPLSKTTAEFPSRNRYMIFFAITMFLSGGLIPTYIIIKNYGLINNFWVLILPGAVNIWNVIIMMNFIRGLPKSVGEAAFIDGANHWQTLFFIILPMSLPALASLLLFTMIGHWNTWFDGMFYMNTPEKYPMATYLATQIISNNKQFQNMTPEMLKALNALSETTVRSAQLFISIVPILIVYPLLQRFFIKGIVVGSVK